MVHQPSKNPKTKSSKSKTRTQEHIIQFKSILDESKIKFMERMSASVKDIGDIKLFEIRETIGSGAFGVVVVV
ncbi:hypothetical protein Bhyg_10596 [Pseudolycoriella hygida]|uniref:Uncharacterized protein n=1 Tax=Pseudolycoriella hygida TaxID=35572 RepID=A0A9Q0MVB1_9DIPT|nr:hypothetical protein Bhyg_10596 [Pseudolycoriella hygida]